MLSNSGTKAGAGSIWSLKDLKFDQRRAVRMLKRINVVMFNMSMVSYFGRTVFGQL